VLSLTEKWYFNEFVSTLSVRAYTNNAVLLSISNTKFAWVRAIRLGMPVDPDEN